MRGSDADWHFFTLERVEPRPRLRPLALGDPSDALVWARAVSPPASDPYGPAFAAAHLLDACLAALQASFSFTPRAIDRAAAGPVVAQARSAQMAPTANGFELYTVSIEFLCLGGQLVCEVIRGERQILSLSSRRARRAIPANEVRRRGAVYEPHDLHSDEASLHGFVAAAQMDCHHRLLSTVSRIEDHLRQDERAAIGGLLGKADQHDEANHALGSCVVAAEALEALAKLVPRPAAKNGDPLVPDPTIDIDKARDRAQAAVQAISAAATFRTFALSIAESRATASFQSAIAVVGAALLVPNLVAALWGAGLLVPTGREPWRSLGAASFVVAVALLAGASVHRLQAPSWQPWREPAAKLAAVGGLLVLGIALALLIVAGTVAHP